HELALRALDTSPELASARDALAAHDARVAEELAALDATHRIRRARRRTERDRVEGDATRLHALDQESRGDAAERKRLEAARAEIRGPMAERVAAFERERTRLERLRADESRDLMKRVHDTYAISNARGEHRPLRELFASGEPPAGAGDCAGPKLLGQAYRLALRPLALAQVWWGAPPATGGRHAGTFYPSCRGKCGPILPHMLEGLPVEEPPVFGGGPIASAQPPVVFEDAWLVVVDKPIGLLSVPGRSGALRDSVQTRLRARYPDATGPLVVHRLDLDTSGLLLAAKDEATYGALQAQFARREIDKRYIAWLDGVVAADAGVVDLPIRVDLDDRPRQIHDPVHGKAAITEWSVLERGPRATRVALIPKTGRTHQLRVHAAHPLGIGAPIVGDRLYGRYVDPAVAADQGIVAPHPRADAPRLMLHAERLSFVHPHTGARIELERAAPF
nr:RluA family pseudouridine synthase [Deltaproteobacteria bacterium]